MCNRPSNEIKILCCGHPWIKQAFRVFVSASESSSAAVSVRSRLTKDSEMCQEQVLQSVEGEGLPKLSRKPGRSVCVCVCGGFAGNVIEACVSVRCYFQFQGLCSAFFRSSNKSTSANLITQPKLAKQVRLRTDRTRFSRPSIRRHRIERSRRGGI